MSVRNGGGAEMTDLTDNAGYLHRAKPRGATAGVLGDRQSLAPYWQAKPAPTGPDVVSRPVRAAPAFLSLARARSARTGNAVTVRAARGAPATRVAAPPAIIGKRPVSSGLVRFDDFEMQWNGNAACAVAVQRNGEAAN